MEQNKKLEILDECANYFIENGDTFFAILSPVDNDKASVVLCGDRRDVSEGFYQIFKRAVSDNEEEGSEAVLDAILNAMCNILVHESKRSAVVLMGAIDDMVATAVKERFGKDDEEEEDNEEDVAEWTPDNADDFDENDKECQSCADYDKCKAEVIIRKAREMRKKKSESKKKDAVKKEKK